MEAQTPINYVFLDFENVQDVNLDLIGSKAVHFTLLLGAKQTKLAAGLVEKLVSAAPAVQFIRLKSSGKQALDLALGYYLGRAVEFDPAGYFHIVSKDKGFDALLEHLKSRHMRVYRHDSFETLTFGVCHKPKLPTPDDPFTVALMHLRKQEKNRPKRQKTLLSGLAAHLRGKLSDQEVSGLIERLKTDRRLAIDAKGAVTYTLDAT